MGAVVAGVLVVLGIGLMAMRRRSAEDPRVRRRWTIALVGTSAVAVVGLVLLVGLVVGGPDYSKPVPAFPSLSSHPDAALHGSVAYVVVEKDVVAKSMSGCARVTLASGRPSKDLLCWPFDPAAPVTVAWRDPAHLLVTLSSTTSKARGLQPRWAKVVDVASGSVTDVPLDQLGTGAVPPSGPTRNASGATVVATGGGGSLDLSVRTRSGTRTLLSVHDANPGWGIQSGPAWSPDGRWILWSDGTRLLATTTGARPTTRVLSTGEVFGAAAEHGIQTFAIIGADLDLH